ncbi:MAG: YceI family protein [Microthrixaceae bacterium]
MQTSTRTGVIAGVVAAVTLLLIAVAGCGAVALWALNNSAEDEFELSSTATTAEGNGEADEADTPAEGATTWEVTSGSEAGYRIDEVLRGLEKTATARTEDVTGELTLEGAKVSDATVTVQLEGLTSDAALRDDKVRSDYLETDQFPEATFTLAGPLELSGEPEVGAPVSTEAEGTLELHGVTRDVTVSLDAQLTAADSMEVVGSAPIALADYDIEVPDISGIVKASPEGSVEFKLQLAPA